MKKVIIIFMFIFLIFTIGCSSIKSYGDQSDLKEQDKREVSSKVNKLQSYNDAADKIPILMYHHIMEPEHIKKMNQEQNESVISTLQFQEQMKFLHDNGFYVATLDELKGFIEEKIELPKKTVVITFDDGCLSNAVYAYPVLKQYNFNATIFMIGRALFDDIAEYNFETLQFMNLKILDKYKDVFNYESHTYDLHQLDNDRGLLITSPEEVILDDITKIKELIKVKYFAYPYGHRNSDVIETLKETSHEMAFTIQSGYVTKGYKEIYELPRFGISPNTSIEEFKKIVLIEK
ncbi:putative xylanase/chitin deacetylase [Gottschalkia purinilytica]|uniref:Putative xylanase/chitin deacetylase n=1 Tax=Gottschalkia purinilytica TaxID=1503 RepID=A0A0L0WBY9_GOTPU|nr:polysaccharide deacetylase family protein [Gottschalkia purinilytica]KNF08935.1 putative xylanase/chitin deacetylase [Gottschalkia purinilytica]